jgi:hypothetical protein
MMISMTSNDQFIFTDTSATAATILQHCDAAGNVTIYGLERSRTEDEAVKLQVLETTIQYFNQHVDWLKRGYDSAQEIGNPFSSMETAKALIGSMKTAVAKSRSSRKSKETYLFQNLPPTDQRSRRQVQVHKVPDLTSELAASLNTPTTSILPTVATPSSSTTLPSSSTTTREAKSFSFTIHKKVGTESLWKVTLQIPSSEPQANFYKLALVEMFGVNGEAVQDTKICSVNAVSNFAFSASNEKLLNRSLAKLQKQSEKIMDVNANDLRKQASKVVEDGFKAVFFGWLGNIRKGHDLVSSELKGLDSLFYKLVQEQSTLTKQITTLITSSNRQSLAKRIISNLKTLNTNKQSVTKMLFKTMNVDGKCSIDFPYSLDPTTTFTAFLDTHTLSLRRSDGCYFPAFDIDTAVQKAVNLKLFSEKFGNGSHGLVITDLVTPNFSISSGNAGSSTLMIPRSSHPLFKTEGCRVQLSPGIFSLDKFREKVSVHFPITVHWNLRGTSYPGMSNFNLITFKSTTCQEISGMKVTPPYPLQHPHRQQSLHVCFQQFFLTLV